MIIRGATKNNVSNSSIDFSCKKDIDGSQDTTLTDNYVELSQSNDSIINHNNNDNSNINNDNNNDSNNNSNNDDDNINGNGLDVVAGEENPSNTSENRLEDTSPVVPDKIFIKEEEDVSEIVEMEPATLQDDYPSMSCLQLRYDTPTDEHLYNAHDMHDMDYTTECNDAYNTGTSDNTHVQNIPNDTNIDFPPDFPGGGGGYQILTDMPGGSVSGAGYEKVYKCDVCNKSYSTKNNLNRHLKKHTGADHYQCDGCDKTFSRHDNMLKHQRLHVYACTVCTNHFTMPDALEQHMLNFHGVVTWCVFMISYSKALLPSLVLC